MAVVGSTFTASGDVRISSVPALKVGNRYSVLVHKQMIPVSFLVRA
jgi:hypothetical protein